MKRLTEFSLLAAGGICLAAAALVLIPSCDDQNLPRATGGTTQTQTVGGYTFTYVGELKDGTRYERFVWEVTAPDGKKFLAIRGYGIADTAREQRGKTSVEVEP